MRKKRLCYIVFSLVLVALFLAACSGQVQNAASISTEAQAQTPQATENSATLVAPTGMTVPESGENSLMRTDEQGQVVVEITPINMDNPREMLDFQVVMNTHSVDLGMNLAELATLTTDTGKTVQAAKWDAPGGGHHVEGTLSFPAVVDGTSILDGARQVTLTLVNIDVPERIFTWDR